MAQQGILEIAKSHPRDFIGVQGPATGKIPMPNPPRHQRGGTDTLQTDSVTGTGANADEHERNLDDDGSADYIGGEDDRSADAQSNNVDHAKRGKNRKRMEAFNMDNQALLEKPRQHENAQKVEEAKQDEIGANRPSATESSTLGNEKQ